MEIIRLFFVFAIANSMVMGLPTTIIKTPANLERNLTILSKSRIFDEEICGDVSYTGVCLNTTECAARGGSSSDTCWNGDECCKIVAKCPSISSPCIIRHSGTTVLNETGISDYRRTLRFMKSENICQLRLDFDEFDLAQPNANGDCTTDSMQVISSRTGISICGVNNQQHLYLEFGYQPYIDAIMRICNSSKYRIRSTLIGCNSESRAPTNCLQYFTEFDGTVRSFNFGYAQLNNADYSVCVGDYDGANSIKWNSCRGQTNPFFVSGAGFGVIVAEGTNCKRDWVQIYGANRFCGKGIRPVISTVKPFMMNVHFDEAEGYTAVFPTDPTQCDGITIEDPYADGKFVGGFDEGMCTWNFVPNDPTNTDPNEQPDSMNTGFCLDFAQMI